MSTLLPKSSIMQVHLGFLLIFIASCFFLFFSSISHIQTVLSQQPNFHVMKIHSHKNPIRSSASSENDLCYGCLLLAQVLDSFITSNITAQEVIKLATKICPYLQPEIQPVCPLLVKQMTPEILEILVTRENPHVLCQQLGACKNDTALVENLPKKN
ncbi:hypothetical protein C9374_010997 [Naegleria lovaniensis]|uniref:Saposin B-type domain-containing protein n=1 Tax=Naegleria lovaniensis TaxID=51637 RepID=A0AA88GA20_NAELO|nr:uncharacterized protein C9374_010997 [Naegleria lovaniensis]KAG2374160.1 hypothetical protein C9374_010997 [Naegleria lovaniensis]